MWMGRVLIGIGPQTPVVVHSEVVLFFICHGLFNKKTNGEARTIHLMLIFQNRRYILCLCVCVFYFFYILGEPESFFMAHKLRGTFLLSG